MRISAFLLALVLTGSLSGCGAIDVLTTPYRDIDTDPSTEVIEPVKDSDRTPAQDLVENAPKVISNPANLEAWLAIGGAITTVILGGGGIYGVKKYRARKAAQ